MTVKKYIISKNVGNFTTIPNKVLQGLKNYEALGLYVYMASLSHGWEFHKNQLAEHANIGREKVEKLLRILAQHCLINIVHLRNEKGQFAHFEVQVDDGTSFKINELQNSAQPYTEKPLTVIQLPVNSSYKENNKKLNKEHKENISCASKNNARNSFDDFWEKYPKKKDKARTKKIWDKKKYNDEQVRQILTDVENRKRLDHQWQTRIYVPQPSTYLNNKLYEDEIISISSPSTREVVKTNEVRSTVKWFGNNH